MRCVGDGNDALPSLSLACVIEDRQAPGRLDDLEIETGVAAKVRQGGLHTPLTEPAIFWVVGSIDRAASRSASTGRADRHVVRRRLRSPGRWRPILAAFATGQFVLAQVGRLDQGEVILAHDRSFLLRLWRERRNSAVRRIHDQRRPTTHAFMCGEHRSVVRAADLLLRSALATVSVRFPTDGVSALLVELSSFLVGEELPVCVLGWALQRDLAVARPETLQVRFTPRSNERR